MHGGRFSNGHGGEGREVIRAGGRVGAGGASASPYVRIRVYACVYFVYLCARVEEMGEGGVGQEGKSAAFRYFPGVNKPVIPTFLDCECARPSFSRFET